ncbi:MAG TPA: hypothetical protein VGL05_24530 [Kribbella sp.]
MITGHNIGARIVSEFPDARDSVAEVIEMYGQDIVGPAMFSYVSVGFFHPVCDPAIQSNDVARIEQCYRFLEELLASPDLDIVDATVIRVVPWTLGPDWIDATRRFGGPLLRAEVDLGKP